MIEMFGLSKIQIYVQSHSDMRKLSSIYVASRIADVLRTSRQKHPLVHFSEAEARLLRGRHLPVKWCVKMNIHLLWSRVLWCARRKQTWLLGEAETPPLLRVHFGNARFHIGANTDGLFTLRTAKHGYSPLTQRLHRPEPEQIVPSSSANTRAEGYLSVYRQPEENVCETFAHISPVSRDWKARWARQGSIMPSNKFICKKVVKRGWVGDGGWGG